MRRSRGRAATQGTARHDKMAQRSGGASGQTGSSSVVGQVPVRGTGSSVQGEGGMASLSVPLRSPSACLHLQCRMRGLVPV